MGAATRPVTSMQLLVAVKALTAACFHMRHETASKGITNIRKHLKGSSEADLLSTAVVRVTAAATDAGAACASRRPEAKLLTRPCFLAMGDD